MAPTSPAQAKAVCLNRGSYGCLVSSAHAAVLDTITRPTTRRQMTKNQTRIMQTLEDMAAEGQEDAYFLGIMIFCPILRRATSRSFILLNFWRVRQFILYLRAITERVSPFFTMWGTLSGSNSSAADFSGSNLSPGRAGMTSVLPLTRRCGSGALRDGGRRGQGGCHFYGFRRVSEPGAADINAADDEKMKKKKDDEPAHDGAAGRIVFKFGNAGAVFAEFGA